jgi:hypothetical protein
MSLLRNVPLLVHALAAEHLLLFLHQNMRALQHGVDEAQLMHPVRHVHALRVKAVAFAAGNDGNAAKRINDKDSTRGATTSRHTCPARASCA